MKKIPDHAKKVFEGIIFDVYHWDQEMFDGSTSTFEAVRRVDSVTLLAVSDNKILINKEHQPGREPFIALPGGRVDKEEVALNAAKRELLEETGYVSDAIFHWFTVDSSDMAKLEWSSHYFIAKNCTKDGIITLDSGEKIETTLITLDELLEKVDYLGNRNNGIKEKLRVAQENLEEKQKLKDLLGITA
jgi:ADP-ribose pyrophosphatase